jgi:hypothetical protein
MVAIKEGNIKLSGPKINNDNPPHNIPVIAGILLLEAIHCSTNITVKRAVMAKSMPFVLNLINSPAIAPNTDPDIQYN